MQVQNEWVEIAFFTVLGLLAVYYVILFKKGFFHRKQPTLASSKSTTPFDLMPRIVETHHHAGAMELPPAIDNALEEPEDDAPEFLDYDGNILLKEAERVVDKIQDTINNIASSPANPEEVTSKISAIVRGYQLFFETEYYDSINTFIALVVERDCGIKLSVQQLQELWN